MAVYAIGDVQGCHDQLVALLDLVEFEPERDRLCFVGDLVNRGPASLAVLRFVESLGDRATVVLGNHDLHLLAAAAGARPLRKKDTFHDVLEASDRERLLDWLRTRPLIHREPGHVVVHAGVPPQWTIEDAVAAARRLEAVVRGPQSGAFFARMYGDRPDMWSADLEGWDYLRFVTNALTRMRYCHVDGRIDVADSAPPGRQAHGLVPWFACDGRRSHGTPIVFGHWATLQTEAPLDPRHGVYHVDTGCVWGGSLTALRLDDRATFSVPGYADAPTRESG